MKDRENIEGRDTWVLEVTQDGWTFDMLRLDTGLMARFDTNTGEANGASKVLISDYRTIGHMQVSFGAAMITNKIVWSRKLTEAQFNVPVDDGLFRKP